MPDTRAYLTRDQKAENLVTNLSLIMMGMFEGIFATMASGLATAMGKTVEAVTAALDDREVHTKTEGGIAPLAGDAQLKAKVKEAFSSLRREVAEGFSNKDENFRRFIKDPSFDAGIRIVEGHRLNLPPLTESLTDGELAKYMSLVQSGDPEVASMIQELGEWQRTTPRFEH
jgi:hypothetical protein